MKVQFKSVLSVGLVKEKGHRMCFGLNGGADIGIWEMFQ